MATIKSYTDLEQSKKLAKFLPLESADMKWFFWREEIDAPKPPTFGYSKTAAESYKDTEAIYLPCWSLTSLVSILPDTINGTEGYCRLTIDKEGDAYNISYDDILSEESTILFAEYSLIDACVEMIVKLHEQNIL